MRLQVPYDLTCRKVSLSRILQGMVRRLHTEPPAQSSTCLEVYALGSENCAAIERNWQIKTFNFSVDLQDVTNEDRYFISNYVTLQLSWRTAPTPPWREALKSHVSWDITRQTDRTRTSEGFTYSWKWMHLLHWQDIGRELVGEPKSNIGVAARGKHSILIGFCEIFH